ncbi:MAG TPA: PAS domain S-box protein [Kofleriaceae bacterium]|nr:PAS domain S-box protein [Kofleriaceae bacterium]
MAAIFSAAVALIILVGWFAEVPGLTSLGAFGPPMAASTAFMTLLTCVALWSRPASVAGRSRWIVNSCALAVSAIAVLALVYKAGGTEVDLDRMVPHISKPWHAAPQTAFAFLLLASAMLSGNRRFRGVRPGDLFALGALAIATVALIGYVFDVPVLYGKAPELPHVGMSVPAAFVVLALGLGYLVSDIEHSLVAILVAADAGGVAARRLFAGAIAFPPGAALLLLGPRLGWYSYSFGEATVLLLAIAEGSILIMSTATRLSRADRALRASEAHVRLLVDQASDPIFIADSDARFIDVNDAACTLTGLTRDALLEKRIFDIVSPEDVPRLEDARARLRAGASVVEERSMRRIDGTYVPVEINAKILPDGRWQAIARDITERKRNDAALARAAETERSLRAELEALMAAVSHTIGELPHSDVEAVLRTIAEQARILTSAKYAAAAIGTDPNKPFDRWVDIGMSDAERAAIGPHPRPVGVLGHAAQTGTAFWISSIAEYPDAGGRPPGLPPFSNLLAVPIKHRDRVIGTLYLADKQNASEFSENDARIVTRLADRVAAALETATLYADEGRLRAWLQTIIDQLPDGVIVIDEHAQVKAMNRAVREMSLPHANETDPWGNPTVFDVRDSEQRPVPADDLPIIHALRTGETVRRGDLFLGQADGRMLPIEAVAGPVRDDLGRITGAVVVVTDVSERRETERLREEWIAVVAHDLRQPLNTILLWADRLASLVKDEKPRAAIERVRRGAWRLNRMIHDLLDAARLQANQLSVEPRAVDAVAIARATIDNAHLTNPEAQIRLTAAEHELVWADEDRIQQVLANLLSNALKYGTPATPVQIEIKNREPMVEISVINEGPELSAEDRERLFSRFSRTAQARSAKIPGIGLGLYICKGLVEAHGGAIRVESGNGTVAFRFTLPRPPED